MKKPTNQVRKNGSAPRAARQAKLEYSGKFILTNYWMKIGVSRAELKALREVSRLFVSKKYQTTGRAARLVLTTALMNWEKLEPLVYASQKYADDEGFAHLEYFQEDTIARKFKRMASAAP